MFVKKIIKNNETYFILTICNKVDKGTGKGKDNDTQFISCFIPSELANHLINLGVTLVDKSKPKSDKE